eukprot:3899818-Amphidinium_carterae.1
MTPSSNRSNCLLMNASRAGLKFAERGWKHYFSEWCHKAQQIVPEPALHKNTYRVGTEIMTIYT